jgi:hypothetical protein
MMVFSMRFTLVILLLAFVQAGAFPVPKDAGTASIAGTTWSGDGVVAATVYTFNADGSMTYSYNGATHTNGHWKQDGTKIYWECNNKYCEFEGKLDGNDISGKAWNVENFNKELKFSRVKE